MESSCLEVFKTRLKKAFSKLVYVEVGSEIIAVPALSKGLLILRALPSNLCMTVEKRIKKVKNKQNKKKKKKKAEGLLKSLKGCTVFTFKRF